jgi:hypothetical protein
MSQLPQGAAVVLVQFDLLFRLPILIGNGGKEGVFTPIWERLDLRKEEVPPATQFIDTAVTCHLA